MSKFFHLAKKRAKRIHHKRLIPTMKISLKAANIFAGILVGVMVVTYLIQINGLAIKGYQIKELENKITELKQEKADLELEALGLQSMGSVKEKVENLGLVAVGETEYLQPTPVVMAR